LLCLYRCLGGGKGALGALVAGVIGDDQEQNKGDQDKERETGKGWLLHGI
jgi:hypothetical protein